MRERESIGIPLLRDGDRVISSNSGKANVLNSYFKSVFTAEVTLTIPSKDSSPFPDIADNFPLLLLYESRGGSSDFRLPTSNFRLPTSDFRLPTSNFRLPTSDFRLPTFVAMKGGDRPTRLLPYAKMLFVPITFFSFCWVDYALEGSG